MFLITDVIYPSAPVLSDTQPPFVTLHKAKPLSTKTKIKASKVLYIASICCPKQNNHATGFLNLSTKPVFSYKGMLQAGHLRGNKQETELNIYLFSGLGDRCWRSAKVSLWPSCASPFPRNQFHTCLCFPHMRSWYLWLWYRPQSSWSLSWQGCVLFPSLCSTVATITD